MSFLAQKNLKTIFLITAPTVALAGFFYWRYSRVRNKETKSCQSLKDEGNRLFKSGQFPRALELYTEAISVAEQDNEQEKSLEQLYQNRAAVWEKLNHHTNVIRETTLALKLNNKYVKALHRRSKAYKATGFLDEALEDVTCVCILEQFSSPSSVQLADEILKEIGAAEGQRLLTERESSGEGVKPSAHTCISYLRGFYNCPISRILRGELELESGPLALALKKQNYDEIIPLCLESINQNKFLIQSHYMAGTFAFLYGQPSTLAHFKYVVDNSQDKSYTASALIKMASHYALVEREEECEQCFAQSEKIWGDNVDLWNQRGQVLLTRGELPQALAQMSKATELAPNFPIASATKWYVQYRILSNSGDLIGSQECILKFQEMTKSFEKCPDVFSLYGQILMETGRFTEAEEMFERVRKVDEMNAGVIVHSAMSRFQRDGDVAVAIERLKKAAELDDRNEFVFETLGTLYLQSGDLPNAIIQISKALKLARSIQELSILSSLKKAAEVQAKVKDSMGLAVQPAFFK